CSFLFLVSLPLPRSTLFPYAPLFRSSRRRFFRAPRISGPEDLLDRGENRALSVAVSEGLRAGASNGVFTDRERLEVVDCGPQIRSEEHTSELQSRVDIGCRLLLAKKQ